MREFNEYLSDEELNKLIDEIEQEGETVAPYSIEETVLSYLDKKREKKTTKISYYVYCMKVSVSIAAAILMMVLLPYFKNNGTSLPSKKDVMEQEASISKEELLSREVISSREEALNKRTEKDRIEEMKLIIHSKIEEISE